MIYLGFCLFSIINDSVAGSDGRMSCLDVGHYYRIQIEQVEVWLVPNIRTCNVVSVRNLKPSSGVRTYT